MDTHKLAVGSVSTNLNNLLQPVRHTLHHVAQNLDFGGSASILALLWKDGLSMCIGRGQNIPQVSLTMKSFRHKIMSFCPYSMGGPLYLAPLTSGAYLEFQRGGMHMGTGTKFFCILCTV